MSGEFQEEINIDSEADIEKLKNEILRLRKSLNVKNELLNTKLDISEKKYEHIFENAEVGIFQAKLDGSSHIAVNRKHAEILGYTKEEMRNMAVEIVWADKDECWSEMKKLIQKGELINEEVRLRKKDGTIITVVASVKVFEKEKFIEGTMYDISERKTAEEYLNMANKFLEAKIGERTEKLQKSEEKYRQLSQELTTIIDSMPGPVFYKDTMNNFIRVNEYIAAAHKTTKDSLEGKNLLEIYPKETALKYWNDDMDVIKSGKPKLNIEEEWHTEIGKKYVLTSKMPYFENGNIIGIIGISMDITERKAYEKKVNDTLIKAKEKAESEVQSKTRFLTNMSHEIRTPLNGIIGILDILKHTRLDIVQRKNIDIMEKSSENLLHVINEILDYSKIEADRFNKIDERYHIRESFAKLYNLFSASIKSHMEMTFFVSENVPEIIETDKIKLENIIINLIGNAIKFTEKGEIIVSAGVTEKNNGIIRLRICVEDTGIGIPESRQSELFTSFTQIDESLSRKYGGTGLGLVIAQGYANILGGGIKVESEFGKGSKFILEINCKVIEKRRFREKPYCDSVILYLKNNKSSAVIAEMAGETGIETCYAGDMEELQSIIEINKRERKKWCIMIDESFVDEGKLGSLTGFADSGECVKIAVLSESMKRIFGINNYIIIQKRSFFQEEILDAIKPEFPRKELKPSIKNYTSKASILPKLDKNIKVMVIEDNAMNTAAIKQMFKLMRIDAVCFENAVEALAFYENEDANIVLTDIQLPDISGFEAAKIIRKIDEKKGSRSFIIAVTAHSMHGYREKCLEAGMDDYLSKPFKTKDLYEVISKYADLKYMDDEIIKKLDDEENKNVVTGKMFPKLFMEFNKSIAKIKGAVMEKNVEIIKHEAHKMKGSFSMYGEEKITGMFAEMESEPEKTSFELLDKITGLLNKLSQGGN